MQPILPLARAFEAAGHSVAVAVHAELCHRVETAGLIAFPAGTSLKSWFAELERRHPDRPWDQLPRDGIMQWFLPRLFGDVGAPAMLDDLLRIAGTWRPDALVHETFELAGPVCAKVAGIPSVHHTLGPVLPDEAVVLAAASTACMRQEHGVDPIARVGDDAALCVDICPPSMQTAPHTSVVPAVPLRPVPAPPVLGEQLPAWLDHRSNRPLVHATLGTQQVESEQWVLARVIEGLRDEPVDLVVTVGPNIDPEAFGEQPPNVHVERYISHSLLLPHCALVIGHGGAGTMLGALANGLPLLTIPLGADQYISASMCERRGLGRTLIWDDLTPATVREAARTLLDDPEYAVCARSVQDEIGAMPSPAEVVQVVEAL